MCDWLFVDRPAELSDAITHVERLEATARALEAAGDHVGAAQAYLGAAEALASISGHRQAAEIEDHRLVEYANVANALLNDGRVEEARRAILLAASRDLPLANELRAMVAGFPGPASCSRAQASATTAP